MLHLIFAAVWRLQVVKLYGGHHFCWSVSPFTEVFYFVSPTSWNSKINAVNILHILVCRSRKNYIARKLLKNSNTRWNNPTLFMPKWIKRGGTCCCWYALETVHPDIVRQAKGRAGKKNCKLFKYCIDILAYMTGRNSIPQYGSSISKV